jgi:hypothetical protein
MEVKKVMDLKNAQKLYIKMIMLLKELIFQSSAHKKQIHLEEAVSKNKIKII